MKKSSEKDQLFGNCPSFFFDISITNSKTSNVNQWSVLNLEIFHNIPKYLHRLITFNSVVLKNTELQIYFFQQNK